MSDRPVHPRTTELDVDLDHLGVDADHIDPAPLAADADDVAALLDVDPAHTPPSTANAPAP